MPSAQETHENIGHIRKAATDCLARCRTYPSPSHERLDRILRIEAAIKTTTTKTQTTYSELIAPAHRRPNELNEQYRSIHEDINKIQQEINSTQDNKQRAELQQKIKTLQQTTQNIQTQLSGAQTHAAREQIAILARPSAALEEIEQDLRKLLDEAGTLEKDIDKESRIGEELRQITKADFESKSNEFEEASTFHRSQARRIYWAILAMVLAAGAAIYYLFIHTQIPTNAPPGEAATASLERMIFFGLGRIALLFFSAWVIKYLSELHRSHSEQSVIYRDRKAALGVAQSMLNAAPELAQKQELLRTLAVGYLDFDQNAFRSRRLTAHAENATDDTKRLKDLIYTVRPLLDSLKGMVERPK